MLDQQFLNIGGVRWRFTKIPAWYARNDKPNLLSSISAYRGGSWIALDCDEVVDELVPSWELLGQLEKAASEYNYGFLEKWRPVRMPSGMGSNATVKPRYMDSMFSALISAQYATLHEMKTIYSLEDVFMMIEVLTVQRINEHNAMERK